MTHTAALRRIIRTARAERVWPSGWWLPFALLGGIAGWYVLGRGVAIWMGWI